MIETKIEGSPASVRSAATWVQDTLWEKIADASEHGVSARQRAGRDWEGSAAEAYREVANRVIRAGDEQEKFLGRVAEKLRTYAVKLTHAQDRMVDRRSEAAEGGLTVVGTVIQTPPEPQRPADLPVGSSEEERAAWDVANDRFEEANEKVELYNRLLEEAEQERATLDEWIDANLVTSSRLMIRRFCPMWSSSCTRCPRRPGSSRSTCARAGWSSWRSTTVVRRHVCATRRLRRGVLRVRRWM